MNNSRRMVTTVNLPDSLYLESQALAASRGATVKELIVDAVEKVVLAHGTRGNSDVELPIIRSKRPGTLDLSNFDFDNLLA
jgi:hypothetical protein